MNNLGTILLGFADDMLDLPWRYKLIFPFFIIIPTVSCYSGTTSVILPYPFSMILE
jgi:UDP-N-acetylglucosamine--dolichyl-phosphate N-acetylglucosaminephosphotransferase